nr:hypothetical protein [Tanacetum cinerariifolium]
MGSRLLLRQEPSMEKGKYMPRKAKRKDTQVPQLSGPTESVADEAVYKKLDDSLTAAKARTINGEGKIHAKVDGKKVITSEASIRRDPQFGDEKGVDCLPTATIFENLTLMGTKLVEESSKKAKTKVMKQESSKRAETELEQESSKK